MTSSLIIWPTAVSSAALCNGGIKLGASRKFCLALLISAQQYRHLWSSTQEMSVTISMWGELDLLDQREEQIATTIGSFLLRLKEELSLFGGAGPDIPSRMISEKDLHVAREETRR